MIKQVCTVPDQVRAKARAHSAATNRAKLTRWSTVVTPADPPIAAIRSALERAQRGAPARRTSQMNVAGRTTLTSTNTDPSSCSGGTALPPCPQR